MKTKLIYFFILYFAITSINAQGDSTKIFSSKDPFGVRVFVENKGQFKDTIINDSIYFALDTEQEKIYFTNKGLVYKLIKNYPPSAEEMEEIEEGHPVTLQPSEVHYVNVNFVNSNENLIIEKGDAQNYYFSYGNESMNAYSFRKITYKNIYNNIDIEYIIPNDRDHGIKYTFIARPGSNPNDIRIAYTGAVNSISLNLSGNIIVDTPLDDIIEHSPNSFDSNNTPVSSSFSITNNQIGFIFPNGYQTTNTLIIDPWVSNITTLLPNNSGFDVDYDYGGNTYVYGGGGWANDFKVAKYSAGGLLLWTFSGLVVSQSWNSGGQIGFSSNFVVNKSTYQVYVGQFQPYPTARIIRLNFSGNYDNYITPSDPTWIEVNDMAYSDLSGRIYALGGGTHGSKSGSVLNPITGAVNPVQFFDNSYGSTCHDICAHAIDDQDNLFALYNGGSPGLINQIAKLNSAFTSSVWFASTTYNTMAEVNNKGSFINAVGGGGYNGLAVNGCYLYYYDGLNLAVFDKNNGSKIAFTTIPSLNVKEQGGIAVDDFNNVFVGGNNSVLCFYFNGTSFNPLPSISLNALSVNKFVFDVKLNRTTKLLYVSGSGFVGVYNVAGYLPAANQISCLTPCPLSNINFVSFPCKDYPLSLSVNSCPNPLATYNWNFGDGNVATGNPVNYTYTGIGTYNISVIILQPPLSPVTLNSSIIITNCQTVNNCKDCIGSFSPEAGDYILSLWVKEDHATSVKTYPNTGAKISFIGSSSTYGPFYPNLAKNKIIDGWQRIEEKFTVPVGATSIKIELINNNSPLSINSYFDDIRIHPVNGNMKSYVYDPVTLRLSAELDENNYATFYEYDEEGKLIRVKKETERGIMTVKEARNNTKKK